MVRFTASQPSSIAFTCSFTNLQTATYTPVALGGGTADLVMHADVTFIGDSRYTLGNAVKYDARVRLVATGGTVATGANSISVTNANEVTLYLGVVSNVKAYNDLTADYVTICSNNVANAAALGYDNVRQAQQQDYTNLFNRVVLDLGVNPGKTSLDLGYRKKQIVADPNDPNLFTLLFQMGRYLMISGSRPGSQPLNLQGKWNDRHDLYAGWGSKMTININEQMNYWGAEVANLAECHEPLFDLIKDLSETGHKVALSNYFCTSTNAWVAHHNTDLWRNAGPVNNMDGILARGRRLALPASVVALSIQRRHQLADHQCLSADERRRSILPGFSRPAPDVYPRFGSAIYGDVSFPFTGTQLPADRTISQPPARRLTTPSSATCSTTSSRRARFWKWMPRSGPMSSRCATSCRPTRLAPVANSRNGWRMSIAVTMPIGTCRIWWASSPGTRFPHFMRLFSPKPPRYQLICGVLQLTPRGAGRGE